MSGPLIQVQGVSPVNKGATLMLEAVRAELARRLPGARLGMEMFPPEAARMDAGQRLRHGLWSIAPESWSEGRGKGRLRGAMLDRLGPARDLIPVARPDAVTAVLDASGFAYGDFWGRAKFVRRLGARTAGWKARGRRVIALPQAWGPFEAPGFAEAVRAGLAPADLVFARDPRSLAFLEAAGAEAQLAPDFTNLLSPGLPGELRRLRGGMLLIPNAKTIEAGVGEGAYLDFLSRAARTLEGMGETRVLIHEGAGDRALAARLNAAREAAGAAPLEVVDPDDPLAVKAVIGASGALISSRFHGLVSALSAGVPALACGWSHKYLALLEDYGAGERIVDLDSPGEWDAALAGFAGWAGDSAARRALAAAAAGQKARAAAAWDRIEAVLRDAA
ncbi:MAG: polysaccharide pyruvyl transferase family protein [Hasllibacter sp.]